MIDTACFGTNYIGIRGECDDTFPDSGLYINDLPGISLKLAANLATEEEQRGVTLIRRYEQQAIRAVWNDLQAKLMHDISINKVVEQSQVNQHRFDVDPIWLGLTANGVGMQIEKSGCDPYTAIQVNSVQVRANTTAIGQVLTITNALTGVILGTYTFDITAGQVVNIPVGLKTSGKIRITVDGSVLDLSDVPVYGACSCKRDCRCDAYGCFIARGWDGTKEVSKSYGLTANISCICDSSQILCSLKDAIAPLVQLKTAIYLMMDLLTSKRVNFMVANSKDDANNLLLFWNGGVNVAAGYETKGEYWSLLNQTAQGIKGSLEAGKCVRCTTIRYIDVIP